MRTSKPFTKSILVTAVLCFLFLAGCRQAVVFDGSRTSDGSSFRMEYSVLNRTETAEMELQEGDQLQVEIAHDKGSADISVSRPDKDAIYTGTKQVNAEFVLVIPETGVYQITVTGHQAKGQVSFIRTGSEDQTNHNN